ncbi:uncharacterized protein DMENIID0001_004390 [Sergentomyia squamirostris]
MEHSCSKTGDGFCFVCGNFATKSSRSNFTEGIQKAYWEYFDVPVVLNKWWAPSTVCTSCRTVLQLWSRGQKRRMPFSVPTVWKEPSGPEDCFFCLTQVLGFSRKIKSKIIYPDHCSVDKAVPDGHPAKPHPSAINFEEESSEDENEESMDEGSLYSGEDEGDKREFFAQKDIAEVSRKFKFSQRHAEEFCSLMKRKKLCKDEARVSAFRGRNQSFRKFFEMKDSTCVYIDISGLIEAMNLSYDPNAWRLFLDGSRRSFKGVLLHNGNKLPSIPIIYSITLKEDFESLKQVMDLIKWSDHQWPICADYKVVTKLMGIKPGFPKHMCHLCLWDSRDRKQHYVLKDWPKRSEFIVGQGSVVQPNVVPPEKIMMAPLHIKLGLVKNFQKNLHKVESPAFDRYRDIFNFFTPAKQLECNLTGPQIRKIFGDGIFDGLLRPNERRGWTALQTVCSNFLGNSMSSNSGEIVGELMDSFRDLGVSHSLKIHMMFSHLDAFPPNCGDYSDEHGERFHQELKIYEDRFHGKSLINMLAEYCWDVKLEN